MWQGLQTITDYKRKTSYVADTDALLPATNDCGLSSSEADITHLRRVNTRKAPGPDGIPSHVFSTCADLLAGVFMDILNQSLSQSAVPTCFKMATIVAALMKAKVTDLNDCRPIALTSVIIK